MKVLLHHSPLNPGGMSVVFDGGQHVDAVLSYAFQPPNDVEVPCLVIYWPTTRRLPREVAHLQATFTYLVKTLHAAVDRKRAHMEGAKAVVNALRHAVGTTPLSPVVVTHGPVPAVTVDLHSLSVQFATEQTDVMPSLIGFVPYPLAALGELIPFPSSDMTRTELLDALDGLVGRYFEIYTEQVTEVFAALARSAKPREALRCVKQVENIVAKSIEAKLRVFRVRRQERGGPVAARIEQAAARNKRALQEGAYLRHFLLFVANETYRMFGLGWRPKYREALATLHAPLLASAPSDHWCHRLQSLYSWMVTTTDPLDWGYESGGGSDWVRRLASYCFMIASELRRQLPSLGFIFLNRHAFDARLGSEVLRDLRTHYDRIGADEALRAPTTATVNCASAALDHSEETALFGSFGAWCPAEEDSIVSTVARANARAVWRVQNPRSKQAPPRRSVNPTSFSRVLEVIRDAELARIEAAIGGLIDCCDLSPTERRDLGALVFRAERVIARTVAGGVLRRDRTEGRLALNVMLKKTAGRTLQIGGQEFELLPRTRRSVRCQVWQMLKLMGSGQSVDRLDRVMKVLLHA